MYKMHNAWFSFGAGRRVCPMERLSIMQIKVTLVNILQRFRIQYDNVIDGPVLVDINKNYRMTDDVEQGSVTSIK